MPSNFQLGTNNYQYNSTSSNYCSTKAVISVPLREEEDDDCIILPSSVQLHESISSNRSDSTYPRTRRGDDDVIPLRTSLFRPTRMELNDQHSSATAPAPSSSNYVVRFADDRSDSGISSLRSASSGDERSGSRSSALSSSDEPQPPAHGRSPLFLHSPAPPPPDPVRVWRDPHLLLESEPRVRHVHSVQHQTLLMSHPSQPTAAPPGHRPPAPAAGSPAAAGLYSPMMGAAVSGTGGGVPGPGYPLSYHPQMDMLWKQRLAGMSYLLPQGQGEDMYERERMIHHERDRQERLMRQQDHREIEKLKEKDRFERERQEKYERERADKEREIELEKERQEQALHNHFEKSLRKAHQKREPWNPIGGRPPTSSASGQQSRLTSAEDEHRKRIEQEMHQREQRHMNNQRVERDHRAYYQPTTQRSPNPPSKGDYPPPPAHSRHLPKPGEKAPHHSSQTLALPKSTVDVTNMYGYPACQPTFYQHDPKPKPDHHYKPAPHQGGLVVTKSTHDARDHLPNPSPHMSEIKNSVIVKHDTTTNKNTHHLEQRVTIASPSPKLRDPHYHPPKSLYEYRSPTQSPHHLPPGAHHHLEAAQNLNKPPTPHHRSQLPSPHHQRHSPHPSPYRQEQPPPHHYQTQKMYHPAFPPTATSAGASYSVTNTATSAAPLKKVSSPAPHHFYGKPLAGIVSGIPPPARHDSSKPILAAPISPSPYQQVGTYHPPQSAQPAMSCPPPPAHSRPAPAAYAKASPPSAASAPPHISRPHSMQFTSLAAGASVQTQPLDLGMGRVSPKRKSALSPVCLEVKKRRIDAPPFLAAHHYVNAPSPALSRVSEPSSLITSAATTITTVVNTAAYRTSLLPPTTSSPSIINLTSGGMLNHEQLIASELQSSVNLTITPSNFQSELVPASSGEVPQPVTFALQHPVSNAGLLTITPPVETVTTTINLTSGATSATNVSSPVKITTVSTVSTPTPTISSVDSEKSNSPGPIKQASYPVRHLKKAWLQRHTGEDLEDSTSGAIASGNCVSQPIMSSNASNSNSKESGGIHSIHSVGSMAVNSISKTKPQKPANNRKNSVKEPVNGDALPKTEDSSSSDAERGRKSPPKRKPPKVKRKKGASTSSGASKKSSNDEKKRKAGAAAPPASESGSESEKESGSEKDSDSGASSKKAAPSAKEPRKRGRRPKSAKNEKGEEPRAKRPKEEAGAPSGPQRDPFRKPPVGQLKKTGESFLQDGPCFEVAPKLAKCRECRWTPNQRSKNMPNIFCRFYAFRRLRYTKNGQLAIAGFSDPHKDALEDDLKLWLPNSENPPTDLDLETSRFILKQVGDHFCDLFVQEKDVHAEYISDDKTVAWKRVVQGVREMCDVCETTLFNFHWACGKCGFVVCIDCYKSRKSGSIKVWGEPGKDRDEYSWLLCTNRQAHEQEKLMLTQIIAGDSLAQLGRLVHEMRDLWNIEQFCACPITKEVQQKSNNVAYNEIVRKILHESKVNGIKKELKEEEDEFKRSASNGAVVKEEKTSPLSWLADVALSNEDKKKQPDEGNNSSDSDEGSFSTLRELLIRPSHKPNGSSRASSPVPNSKVNSTGKAKVNNSSANKMDSWDEVISSVIEDSVQKGTDDSSVANCDIKSELKHYLRRYNWQVKGRAALPIRIMTLTESKMLYPDVPHSWLCDGKLLRLSDSINKDNYRIFQDQWMRGQPVIVSDVTKNLTKELWHPEAFARDFGDEKNDLINCSNGNIVPNQPMRKFWDGFDHFAKRLKDDRGHPMLLKLKDWPPGEDFAELLPTRFADLMRVLPLAEYTHRAGRLNLASRLPDCFVRPDLGPKMYNAYGSALLPSKGTTNLHLDISDAVNVMVYVGVPKDDDSDRHVKEAFRAIDEAGCDILTRRRVRDKGELPGALWHIYNARDADKIRDLLNKVVVEREGHLEPHNDPIHDQSCYLDGPLRERLYKEYGVEGYAIVQCLGDAVFIPAGAPHQVRNLHNCIKVAEDFVSPENVSHCFHLTQEFRELSDTHTNHEDKLQIKNIIYHAVKDAISCIKSVLNRHANENGVKIEKVEKKSDSDDEDDLKKNADQS